MTLRMHPTSPSRWAQLAASRHVIDLNAAEAAEPAATGRKRPKGDRGHRRRDEHARIQAQVDAIGAQRVPAPS